MTATDQATTQGSLSLQTFVTRLWRILRSPKTTVGLLLVLTIVILLRLIIPQQPTPSMSLNVWLTTVPHWLEPVGEFLFLFGFSRVFHSLLFWLPLSLLMLNSLIGLADVSPPSWRRYQHLDDPESLNWQHPLAHRQEYSVRLPQSPDSLLEALKENLQRKGFSIDSASNENERIIRAGQRHWSWLSGVAFYSALVLLIIAFVVGYYTLRSEQIRLFPGKQESTQLIEGVFELSTMNEDNWTGTLLFTSSTGGQPTRSISWRLYLPQLFANRLLLPVAVNPVITIEATDSTGELRRLLPVRDDLSPDTVLNLPVDQPDEPIYFVIPSASLTFQILPVAADDEDTYNVQVRRGDESSPSENVMIRLGETFEIDGLSITVSPNHSLTFLVRRDPALPIYIISMLIIVVSGSIIYFLSPWQVWLIPEIKGRGGQLYGVVEKMGPAKGMTEFLEALLSREIEDADSDR